MDDPVIIWFLVGLAFLLFEFIVPGFVLFFFGIGAWVVAASSWMGVTDSLPSQLIAFSLISLISLFTLRKYVKGWFVGDSEQGNDEFNTEFVGKKVVVTQAIPEGLGKGKVELKGVDWYAVSSQAIGEGAIVRVVEREGLTLVVEECR